MPLPVLFWTIKNVEGRRWGAKMVHRHNACFSNGRTEKDIGDTVVHLVSFEIKSYSAIVCSRNR